MRYDQHISEANQFYHLLTSFLGKSGKEKQQLGQFILRIFKAPWTFTMKTTRAAGNTGVLFLLCLPAIFFIPRVDSLVWYLLALGGGAFWLWVILLPQTALRYVFQMFPLLSLVLAYILWSLPIVRRKKLWVIGGMSILLSYHVLFLFQVFHIFQPHSFLLKNLSKEEFLVERGVNYYPVMNFINGNTPKESKVLYLGELRSYYCERDILLATDGHRRDDEILLRKFIVESQDARDVLHKLYELKVTHIVANLPEMQRFAKNELKRERFLGLQTEEDKAVFETLFSHYFKPLISMNKVNAYQVLYPKEWHNQE